SADLGAVRKLLAVSRAGRFRTVVLLSHARARTLFVAPAQLAAAGARRHGVLPADRRAERHPGGGAGWPLLGPGRQGVLVARAVAALFLVGVGADLFLSRLPGVAPLVRLGERVASLDAGVRTGVVFRSRPYAAHALLHARGAGLRLHQARPPQGIAGIPR